jgi:hypothetical protein
MKTLLFAGQVIQGSNPNLVMLKLSLSSLEYQKIYNFPQPGKILGLFEEITLKRSILKYLYITSHRNVLSIISVEQYFNISQFLKPGVSSVGVPKFRSITLGSPKSLVTKVMAGLKSLFN